VIYVLDASALQAFLRQEPGGDVVRLLLRDPDNTCFAHVVNLCEVFYDFRRASGEPTAQAVIATLLSASVIPRDDMDTTFWQQAGRHKADYRRVSLADCFGLALAQRVNGELVTADHREFDPLVPIGLCPIRFIR
jgi:PIN domain nuclease of toxin-antitoxin system